MKIFITCVLLLLSCFQVAYSAPIISGVENTVSDGNSITITGTGFGNTGPTVLFFDDLEGGTNEGIISNRVIAAKVGSWRDVAIQMDPYFPTYSNLAAHSGSLSFRQDWGSGEGQQEGLRWGSPTISSIYSQFYFSYWLFIPTGQNVPGACCGDGTNFKVYWLSTNDVFQNDYASATQTNDLPGTFYTASPLNGSQDRLSEGDYFPVPFIKGRWARWEIRIVGSTTNGRIQSWYTDSANARYNMTDLTGDNTLDSGTTGWQYLHFPAFGRYDNNSNTYFDDIYVAAGSGAQARVEIGNNATYSSCTNLAVLTTDSWSDSSIVATVRQGSFSSGTAYLFVVDSDGNVSSGYSVTVGGGGGDTTAPTIDSITTSDPSSITEDSLSVTGTASDAVWGSGSVCKWRIGSAPDASNGTSCTGTTEWTCATSGFTRGANTLYVGCGDAVPNWGSGDSIVVNFSAITPVTGLKIK